MSLIDKIYLGLRTRFGFSESRPNRIDKEIWLKTPLTQIEALWYAARLEWKHLSEQEFGSLALSITPHPFGESSKNATMMIDAAKKFNHNAEAALIDAHRLMDEEWERMKVEEANLKDIDTPTAP